MNESSLSRVRRHINAVRRGKGSFAFLTAWRGGEKKAANKQAMHHLHRSLKKMKLSHTKMKGHGQEGGGKISKEPSLMVHNITHKQAKTLGKRHKQYSIIYAGPETAGKPVHHKFSGEPHEKFGKASFGKSAQYFSSVKGRPFHFRTKKEAVRQLARTFDRWLLVA